MLPSLTARVVSHDQAPALEEALLGLMLPADAVDDRSALVEVRKPTLQCFVQQ